MTKQEELTYKVSKLREMMILPGCLAAAEITSVLATWETAGSLLRQINAMRCPIISNAPE